MARVDLERWHLALAADGSTDFGVMAQEVTGARTATARVAAYGRGVRRAISTSRKQRTRGLRLVEVPVDRYELLEDWAGSVIIARSSRGEVRFALLLSVAGRDVPHTDGLDVVAAATLSLDVTTQTSQV